MLNWPFLLDRSTTLAWLSGYFEVHLHSEHQPPFTENVLPVPGSVPCPPKSYAALAVLGSKTFIINGQRKFVKRQPFCFQCQSIKLTAFQDYSSTMGLGREFVDLRAKSTWPCRQACCSKPNSGFFFHLENHRKTISFHQKTTARSPLSQSLCQQGGSLQHLLETGSEGMITRFCLANTSSRITVQKGN